MSAENPGANDLLRNNAQWAQAVKATDPDFFVRLAAEKQHPKVLWIGCSDSRVSETTICSCGLGDIFTHRNIANMAPLGGDCGEAVIQYAVDSLQVQDIVVAGHTKCGGIEAAWLASREPTVPADTPLQRWLIPLIELSKELHLDRVPLEEKDRALRQLTEENARRQVYNIFRMPFVQDAMNCGQQLYLHSWVFEMEHGILVDVTGPFPLEGAVRKA